MMRRTGPIAAMFALLACSAVWAPLAGCPPTPPPPPELVDDGADVGTRPILIHIPGVGDLILHEDGSTGGVRSSESANGQTWSNANVGELGPAFAPDAARDGQDVHVSYSHRLSGGLRWAALEGGAWAVETADPITNRLGLSAIAVSGDQPTIAYFSANALGALTIANAKRLGPGSWETNEVEGLLPPFQVIWSARPRIAAGGGVTSIAYTVRHARPARGASVNQVRLAQGSGASWTVHTIFDDLGIGGHLADMERDALGTLHLLVYAAP
ncbi:MAG: hypothetical protein K8I02_00255, partial [Candidatus Methylomirabilis sp.]|nr:hypothetical protein [Deltaproteobacteria bacterium]